MRVIWQILSLAGKHYLPRETWDRVSQVYQGANTGGALTLNSWPPNWEYKVVLF